MWQPRRAAETSTNWRQSLFCCCTASMEQATDGAETAAIDGLVLSWSENISVWFSLWPPRYGLTLWCALGLLVGGAIQVPQLLLQVVAESQHQQFARDSTIQLFTSCWLHEHLSNDAFCHSCHSTAYWPCPSRSGLAWTTVNEGRQSLHWICPFLIVSVLLISLTMPKAGILNFSVSIHDAVAVVGFCSYPCYCIWRWYLAARFWPTMSHVDCTELLLDRSRPMSYKSTQMILAKSCRWM